MSATVDVVIVGGGVIGLTTAFFLAKRGQRVLVCDRGELGQEASWAGAGILPPGNLTLAATPYDQLRARSVEMLPQLSAELKLLTLLNNGYRVCGGLEYLTPEDLDTLELWAAEGIAFHEAQPSQVEVGLADVPGVRVFELPAFAQVRNPWHLRALIEACRKFGVQLRPNNPVQDWELASNQVRGVRVGPELVQAREYLIAAGAWSGEVLARFGFNMGIHPVKGQILLFNPGEVVVSRILLFGKRYLVPRADGRVLVGSTEEPEAKFNKENTPEELAELKRFASELVPALRTAPVEKSWAGLRPGSRDGLPTLGRLPGWSNVSVATGHFRAGVQLSAASGLGLAELLTGDAPHWLEPFRVDRPVGPVARPAFRS